MKFAKLRDKVKGKDVLHLWVDDDCQDGDFMIGMVSMLVRKFPEDYTMRIDTYEKTKTEGEAAKQ